MKLYLCYVMSELADRWVDSTAGTSIIFWIWTQQLSEWAIAFFYYFDRSVALAG